MKENILHKNTLRVGQIHSLMILPLSPLIPKFREEARDVYILKL
jgi:hypothetical protein